MTELERAHFQERPDSSPRLDAIDYWPKFSATALIEYREDRIIDEEERRLRESRQADDFDSDRSPSARRRRGESALSEPDNYVGNTPRRTTMSIIRITWQIDDGYAGGGSRPHEFSLDLDNFEPGDTIEDLEEELFEYVDTEFSNKVSWVCDIPAFARQIHEALKAQDDGD